MDLTFEIIREYWEVPQEDATQMGCLLKLSKTISSLLGRHLPHARAENAKSYSIGKFKAESSCDDFEKVVISEIYNTDVNWRNYQCKEPEILKLLINELVTQHLKEIVQCVLTERLKE